jgi:hypothetical protein
MIKKRFFRHWCHRRRNNYCSTEIRAKKKTLEQSIETVIKEVTAIDPTTRRNPIEEKINGAPLDFSANEKHSFQEWLKLSEHNLSIEETKKTQHQNEGKRKNALIDKFIENSPKISQLDMGSPTVRIDTNRDHSSLMTETLAKVYLEQKKISKSDSSMRY